MNTKLLLKTVFLIAILLLLVIMGMHNRETVWLSMPPLLPRDQKLPAAMMYFGFFAVRADRDGSDCRRQARHQEQSGEIILETGPWFGIRQNAVECQTAGDHCSTARLKESKPSTMA